MKEFQPLTIQNLEFAVRPQFVWDPTHRWRNPRDYTNTDTHGYLVGVTVFVGIATLHKFNQQEISNWLNISKARYKYLLSQYKKYIREGIESDMATVMNRKRKIKWVRTYGVVLYVKSQLVQSYLIYHFKTPPVNYADIFSAV